MELHVEHLKQTFLQNNVCISHGIDHALAVLNHAKKALIEVDIDEEDKETVLFAALLHDADDKKLFPLNKNYENLRKILVNKKSHFTSQVIEMVELVSASKNGDRIPEAIKHKMWMLIPRYADRLEAIGIIGIQRCYQYTKTTNEPLYLPSTLRLISEDSIITESIRRYENYSGNSDSMMDHFYDKLIAVSIFPYRNSYFDEESAKRRKPIIDFVKYFGEHGDLDYKAIHSP